MAGVILWLTTSLLSAFLDAPEVPLAPQLLTLLITPVAPGIAKSLSGDNVPLCATNAYYGAYGRPLQHIYGIDEDCMSETFNSLDTGAINLSFMPGPEEGGYGKRTLLWLQDAGVDDTLRNGSSFADDLELLEGNVKTYLMSTRSGVHARKQRLLHGMSSLSPAEDMEVYLDFEFKYFSSSGAIVAVDEGLMPQLDALLPPFVASIALPEKPMPFVPVPKEATERVKEVVGSSKYPYIHHLVIWGLIRARRLTTSFMSLHVAEEAALQSRYCLNNQHAFRRFYAA